MPCRLAKSAACPVVGETTATTSPSSGIALTAPAMQSAWKREPTIPIFTWDMLWQSGSLLLAQLGDPRLDESLHQCGRRSLRERKAHGPRGHLVSLEGGGVCAADRGGHRVQAAMVLERGVPHERLAVEPERRNAIAEA